MEKVTSSTVTISSDNGMQVFFAHTPNSETPLEFVAKNFLVSVLSDHQMNEK